MVENAFSNGLRIAKSYNSGHGVVVHTIIIRITSTSSVSNRGSGDLGFLTSQPQLPEPILSDYSLVDNDRHKWATSNPLTNVFT